MLFAGGLCCWCCFVDGVLVILFTFGCEAVLFKVCFVKLVFGLGFDVACELGVCCDWLHWYLREVGLVVFVCVSFEFVLFGVFCVCVDSLISAYSPCGLVYFACVGMVCC